MTVEPYIEKTLAMAIAAQAEFYERSDMEQANFYSGIIQVMQDLKSILVVEAIEGKFKQ